MSRAGTFTWNELMTSDVAAAKAFYGAVLGWTFVEQPMPDGTYTLAFAPGVETPVGGLFPWPKGNPGADTWGAYVAVDDCDAAVARVSAAGGTVCRAPWDIAGVGRVTIVADATGAVLGFVESHHAG
ncbi:MAG: VOC family protein [Phyllobacteriaceae bacterium]|nr:VOC family protein [Phyllobacteriaceae bacterium]